MTDPYQPYQQQPYQQPYGGPAPYQQPNPYGGAQFAAGPQYPGAQFGGPGAYAPFGYDPMTGAPLSDKSKVAAGLLQLFLGSFGAGRFYIGSNGIALAQLGLTVLGWLTAIFIVGLFILMGVGIWTLVDAIMMFTGGVKDGQGRTLRA